MEIRLTTEAIDYAPLVEAAFDVLGGALAVRLVLELELPVGAEHFGEPVLGQPRALVVGLGCAEIRRWREDRSQPGPLLGRVLGGPWLLLGRLGAWLRNLGRPLGLLVRQRPSREVRSIIASRARPPATGARPTAGP